MGEQYAYMQVADDLERRINDGEIEVKLGFDRTGRLLQVAPEYESCRVAADRSGLPLREMYHAAVQAYRQRSV